VLFFTEFVQNIEAVDKISIGIQIVIRLRLFEESGREDDLPTPHFVPTLPCTLQYVLIT